MNRKCLFLYISSIIIICSLCLTCTQVGKVDVVVVRENAVDQSGGSFGGPIVPEKLNPKFYVYSATYSFGQNIQIHFYDSIVDRKMVGKKVDDRTAISLSPPVKGSWKWESTNRLEFQRDELFAFNTPYLLEIQKLNTLDGEIRPPEGKKWLAQFTTPPFEIERVELEDVDFRKNTAVVVIGFSAAVQLDSVKNNVEVKTGNDSNVKVSYSLTNSYTVTLTISSAYLKKGRYIAIRIKPGIITPDKKSKITKEYRKEFPLVEPARLIIQQVNLREGQKGYYLDVQCYDEAEGDEYYYYSRPCTIDPSILGDFVRLSPAVSVSFSATRTGFRVFGNFSRGNYQFSVGYGLYTVKGSMLTSTYEKSLSVPNRSPKIEFVSRGRYLPREYVKLLPVSHINISAVNISIRQIYEQNIVYWLTSYTETADDRISDLIGQGEYTVKNVEDTTLTSWLDISKLIPQNRKGVFEIQLKAGNSRETARLILTDMAAVVKQHGSNGDQFDLWVLNSLTSKPVSGAVAELYTQSNRVIMSQKTDNDGLCRFRDIKDVVASKSPFCILIKNNDDLIALRFTDLKVSTDDYQVSGLPYKLSIPYQASIYSDSGVYRPGDTAHIGIVIRNESDTAPPEGVPVVGKVIDPKAKVVATLPAKTNSAGMAEFEMQFQAYAATGKYEFVLEIGGNRIESYRFNVEEFVPERLKVTLSTPRKSYLQSDVIPVTIEGHYLFGTVAAGERVEFAGTLKEGTFRPPKNQDYTYTVYRREAFSPVGLQTLTGTLDAKGTIVLEAPRTDSIALFLGPAVVEGLASVFESGSGRTTTSMITIPVHPANIYIGLKTSQKKASSGQTVDVQGIIIDLDGNPVAEKKTVRMSVNRLESEWIWEYDEINYQESYKRYVRESKIDEKDIVVTNGKFQFSFMPESYTEGYIIKANLEKEIETSVMLQGDTYNAYDYDYYSPYVYSYEKTPGAVQPEYLPMQVPEEISVKKEASVVVQPPYPGRLLFTVETDNLVYSRFIDVKTGPVTIPFTVNSFYPNVYVSALLIRSAKGAGDKGFMPGSSFNVSSVRVAPEMHRLSPAITVPKEIKPGEKLDVKVNIGKQNADTFVTVALVDEGILQLTRFETPNPVRDLFRQRALGVFTFETLGWTLRIPPANSSGTGGDTEGKGQGRIMPVKPVILWSGVKKVPPDGVITIPFNIPQYRGQLRVMTVAANKERVGSNDAYVLVRDPLVLQTTLPRFFIGKDSFTIPVFLTNMTGKDELIDVTIKSNASIRIEGDRTKTIALKPDESGNLRFNAVVVDEMGKAEIEVVAQGKYALSTDKVQAPINLNGPNVIESKTVALTSARNNLLPLFKGWKPQYESTTIWVTANKYAEQLSHLKYLIQYPYGCIEQTTSTTRPLLYIADLLLSLEPEAAGSAGIEEKFMHGANRLLSMQTGEGGFSYWPGEQAATYWGTAYATHVLLAGLKQGYPIPQERVNQALAFMEKSLNGDFGNIDAKYGYSVAKSEPYMQYVLALAGRARKGRIIQLIKSPDSSWEELREENLFLLKAAAYIAGDRSYEQDLKKVDTKMKKDRVNGWSFWSLLRTRGMMLDVLEELFPGSPESEKLANSIADELSGGKNSWYFTTQELSWCSSGLGKRVLAMTSAWPSKIELEMDGKIIAPYFTQNKKNLKDMTWVISGASGAKSMSLAIDKAGSTSLVALVSISGLKPGATYEQGDHSISVRRTYLDASMNYVDPDKISLGDLVYVQIMLDNNTKSEIKNIALVDRFCAGLEIENPRLGRSHLAEWINTRSLWETSYMNIRDDRIEFFGHLPANSEVVVYYVLRAVTAGKFNSPPVKAEAMYDPDIWSLYEDKDIIISNK